MTPFYPPSNNIIKLLFAYENGAPINLTVLLDSRHLLHCNIASLLHCSPNCISKLEVLSRAYTPCTTFYYGLLPIFNTACMMR